MKKITLMLLVTIVFGAATIVSCGSEEKKQETPAEVTTEHYQCPMKCTEEVLTAPGQCSVCGMELEKITKS